MIQFAKSYFKLLILPVFVVIRYLNYVHAWLLNAAFTLPVLWSLWTFCPNLILGKFTLVLLKPAYLATISNKLMHFYGTAEWLSEIFDLEYLSCSSYLPTPTVKALEPIMRFHIWNRLSWTWPTAVHMPVCVRIWIGSEEPHLIP